MRHSLESIEKTRSHHIGATRSEEAKAKMRAAWTPDRKKAHIEERTGRPFSAQARANMSADGKGKKLSETHKKAIGAHFVGKKLTEEHKKKVGDGIRRAWTPKRRAEQAGRMREWRRAMIGDTCKRGHPLSGDNLYMNPRGVRICKTCRNTMERRRRKSGKGA